MGADQSPFSGNQPPGLRDKFRRLTLFIAVGLSSERLFGRVGLTRRFDPVQPTKLYCDATILSEIVMILIYCDKLPLLSKKSIKIRFE